MSDAFEFNPGATVAIIVSGENQFLVRYRAADGRAVEAWWNASALVLKETGDE